MEYISNYGGYQTSYGSKFFIIKGDKLFDVGFSTDPLLVPEMRPIGEKILQSFQFTNATFIKHVDPRDKEIPLDQRDTPQGMRPYEFTTAPTEPEPEDGGDSDNGNGDGDNGDNN